jgi:hypothetical protein
MSNGIEVRVNDPLPFTTVLPPVEKDSRKYLPWGKRGGWRENSPGERSIMVKPVRGRRLL